MCGRYTLFHDKENKEIMGIIRQVQSQIKIGEIFPATPAPVMIANGIHAFHWGFPHFRGKSVIINARAETVKEKYLFKNALLKHRCIIPSTGFYEWKSKDKYHFTMPNEPVLYMAGIYHVFGGEARFVILTTAANESVKNIHDRMPLVLSKNLLDDWIGNSQSAMRILYDVPPRLQSHTRLQSSSLF